LLEMKLIVMHDELEVYVIGFTTDEPDKEANYGTENPFPE
jgi:hypothetical protein